MYLAAARAPFRHVSTYFAGIAGGVGGGGLPPNETPQPFKSRTFFVLFTEAFCQLIGYTFRCFMKLVF